MYCRTTSSNVSIRHGHYNRSSVFSIQSRFNTSLRASSPGRSGGGAGKGRRTCNYVSGIWISASKVSAKCWLTEMALVMTSLPLARIFNVWLHSRWLAEIWQLSRRGATGKLEAAFKFQRHSCKLSFLFAPGELARRLFWFKCVTSQKTSTWEAIYKWNCEKYLIRHIDPTKSKWWYIMRHSNSYKVVNNPGYIQQDNQDAKKNSLTCCSSLWNKKSLPNLLSGTST